MESYIFAIEKRDGIYTLISNIKDLPLPNSNIYIDPIWNSIEVEARNLSEWIYKVKFIEFEATCIEDDPDKGTVVYYDAIISDNTLISDFIPVEKTEAQFLELIKQVQTFSQKK